MKNTIATTIIVLGFHIAALAATATAQTTEFTYQGSLQSSGIVANGNHDFQFALFDAATGGSQISSTFAFNNIPVTEGTFSVKLNFSNLFPGADRFLEVRVRPSGGGSHTTLAPRTQITSSPYSIKSATSETATNSLQLGGTAANQFVLTADPRMTDARNPTPGSGNYIQNQNAAPQASSNFSISGSGTVGGTLSANIVSAASQFRIGANRILSAGGTNNLIAGIGAGAVTTGGSNSFFGASAGAANTTGPNNSFFGFSSGTDNTTGNGNSFYGAGAGNSNTIGNNNSAFGINAGATNTSGVNNAFFGALAGALNTANSNSFFGAGAGQANTNGTGNAFFGRSSGEDNTTGGSNSFFGASSGFRNTSGNNNSFFGVNAGGFNTDGFNNAYFGAGAGDLSSGDSNSFFGANAGGGSGNTGNANTFVGASTGLVNTTGSLNTFVGAGAGLDTTTGSRNSFVGVNAGQFNTTGAENAFFGHNAGILNSGDANSFFGRSAGGNNSGGSSNSFFGHLAGNDARNSNGNSFFGKSAGELNTSGGLNTFVGILAGNTNTTGSSNTLLGGNSDVGVNNLNHATAIGADAIVSTSNTIVLGRANGNDKVVIPGLGSGGGFALCLNASDQISLCSSSLRYKSNVAPFEPGLSLIKRLRPVSFNWRDGGHHDLGFVAEEVAKIEPLLTTTNEKGEIEGVKYDRVGVVLVNAVNEQQAQIETQQKVIREQSATIARLASEIDVQRTELTALRNFVCSLNPNAEICSPRK